MSAKDWSERPCAFSFYGVETWLLLRKRCGKKRLNAFSDYTRSVRYFRSAQVYLCCFLWVRYGVKARPACTVPIRLQIFNGANGKVDVCALSNNVCIFRHNFYESLNAKKINVWKRKLLVFISASNFQQINYELSVRVITYFYVNLFLLWRTSKH